MFDDVLPTVCLDHLRFIPCRRCKYGDEMHWSNDPDDVARVAAYHHAKSLEEE
jgi:hypothetical protein